jgi:hypothetical protein
MQALFRPTRWPTWTLDDGEEAEAEDVAVEAQEVLEEDSPVTVETTARPAEARRSAAADTVRRSVLRATSALVRGI